MTAAEPAAIEPAQTPLIRNIAYSLSGGAAQRLLSGVLHFHLARMLGPLGYGIVSLASAAVSLAGVCVSWGTDITGMRAVARAPEHAVSIWRAYTRHRIVLCAAVLVLVLCYASLCVPIGPGRAAVAVGSLQLIFLATSPTFALAGLERILLMNGLTAIGALLQLIATVALVHSQADAVRAVALGAIPPVVLLVGAAVLIPRGEAPRSRPAGSGLIGFVREGAQPVVTWLCSAATVNLDLAIIGALCDPFQTGLYAIGWKLRGVLFSGNALLQTALLPRIAAARGDSRELKGALLYVEAFTGFLTTGVVIASAPGITALLGAKYAGAHVAVSILAIHTGLLYLFQSAVNPLMVEHRESLAMRFYCLEATLSLLAVAIGVALGGVTGAASGAAIAELVTVLVVFRCSDAAEGANPGLLLAMGGVAVSLGYAFQSAGAFHLPVLPVAIVKAAGYLILFPAILILMMRKQSTSICRTLLHGHDPVLR
jgi:O-antigen/teichoic acid export membrane protein